MISVLQVHLYVRARTCACVGGGGEGEVVDGVGCLSVECRQWLCSVTTLRQSMHTDHGYSATAIN